MIGGSSIARLCLEEFLKFGKCFCILKGTWIHHWEDCRGCPVRIKQLAQELAVEKMITEKSQK